MKFFTRDDFWIEIENQTARLGLTEFGQGELGELVFMELPTIGRRVAPGQAFGIVESVKAVAELKTPLGGEIVAVNEAVVENPEVANEAPESDGWLIEMRLDEALDESHKLLSESEYAAHRPSWRRSEA